MSDVFLNKFQSLERCILRVLEEFDACNQHIESGSFAIQDSIILNLQRACENAIDIANQLIKQNKLGLPKTSRDSFNILLVNNVISEELCDVLSRMVGFRNIAVHDYQNLSLEIVQSIVTNHLSDFQSFAECVKEFMKKSN